MENILGAKPKDAKGGSDIEMLKQRFAQLQQGKQPVSQPVQPRPAAPVQPAAVQQPRAAPAQPRPAAPVQTAAAKQPALGGRSPLEALGGGMPGHIQQPQTVNVVEVEGQQDSVVNQAQITTRSDPVLAGQAPEETAAPEDPIEESLEELKEEYDDAKLNSIIIEQVKELIEIDTNLNNKIEDLRLDMNKEKQERDKLKKMIDEHHKELKELEKSIDKFIALYELVTNQFNPFVKQGDTDTKQKMEVLMQDIHNHQQGVPVQHNPYEETDFHFVTKTGSRIKSLHELQELLKGMSDDEFRHHVTAEKNDFSSWIRHALHNEKLAQALVPLKTKEDIINALQAASLPQSATVPPSRTTPSPIP